MKCSFVVVLTLAVAAARPAIAQEVSASVKQVCRATSAQTARTITYAVRSKIDPAT